jgi:hypothetical protein
MPSFGELESLWQKSIQTLDFLFEEECKQSTFNTRLRTLDLSGNPVVIEYMEERFQVVFEKLRRYCPTLSSIAIGDSPDEGIGNFSIEVEMWMDFNKAGRALILAPDADRMVPRSMWPTVLARVDTLFPAPFAADETVTRARQATAMYQRVPGLCAGPLAGGGGGGGDTLNSQIPIRESRKRKHGCDVRTSISSSNQPAKQRVGTWI